ncbi:unnamed protein product [Musa textilis]
MPAVRAGFRRLFSIFAISPPPLATAAPAAESEFRRLFSVSAFSPPLPASARPAAERSTNLFVSGLNKRTTSEGLWEAFSKFGQVVHARVWFCQICHTGRSRSWNKRHGWQVSRWMGYFCRVCKAQTTPTRTKTALDSSSATSSGNRASCQPPVGLENVLTTYVRHFCLPYCTFLVLIGR